MRSARIQRNTRETSITLALTLDGLGKAEVSTGVGFLDHMLELFARHGDFDLAVRCEGDTQVDFHHSVEDIGICLGQAFTQALGDKRGITRYGQSLLPMDETLVLCACDLSGRDYLGWSVDFPAQKVGDFDTELCEEFFCAFARDAGITLHITQLAGKNSHHIIEGAFKAVARSLANAVAINQNYINEIPSTKGVI